MNSTLKTLLKIGVFLIGVLVLIIPIGLVLIPVGGAILVLLIVAELILMILLGILSIGGFLWYLFREEPEVSMGSEGKAKGYSLKQSKEKK